MMHTEIHKCRRCKNVVEIVIATKNVSRVKFISWLECEVCEHVAKVHWTSNRHFDIDQNQLKLSLNDDTEEV